MITALTSLVLGNLWQIRVDLPSLARFKTWSAPGETSSDLTPISDCALTDLNFENACAEVAVQV